jgi:hypothetical protein
MTCDAARIALLDADLPVPDDSSALACHLRDCDGCKRLAASLARNVTSLRASLRQRTRKRRRVVLVGTVSTLAAAAVVVALVRLNTRDAHRPTVVNARPPGIVSVVVPPGKMATVLQTKDPNVTVVWLSNDAGGGL